MEQATLRHACPHGATRTHSETDGCDQPAHLKGVGLEAGGLPEDTNHLSTMLVIEKKGQVPEGLLGKGRIETRLQDRVTSTAPAPLGSTLPRVSQSFRTYSELCQIELRRIEAQHGHQGRGPWLTEQATAEGGSW